jgi:hypothetical protein
MRQMVKGAALEALKAYCDCGAEDFGSCFKDILFGLLRISEKLAELEKLYRK